MQNNQDRVSYLPVRSFVESSFFSTLSKLKLEKFKLNSSEHEINGFMTHPGKLNKFNELTTINLDYTSFDKTPENDTSNIYLPGAILNLNTIDEFKSIDKQKLIEQWGEKIFKDLSSNTNLSYKEFNPIYLLCFSDLKKYKFYYWFAFPMLQSNWILLESSTEIPFSISQEVERKFNEHQFEQFFQVLDDRVINVNEISNSDRGKFAFIDSSVNAKKASSAQLRNYLFFLAYKGYKEIEVFVCRKEGLSFNWKLTLKDEVSKTQLPKVTGWERTNQGKLSFKLADLGSLIDPKKLAEQAVDLNIKLMRWRIAPRLNLEILKEQKTLLLGAGTLGSYVSRTLMGWGVRHITFVDSGRVSYSNPVRQPLFTFRDCFSDDGRGELKAERAAEAVKEIFPGVTSTGYKIEVPMVGHSSTAESKSNFDRIEKLFDAHDVIFLLMDSRESRWLPTVLGAVKDKIIINAALGFDGYLVMRHGSVKQKERLGCYFCNDVVAPSDSLSDRTLDQMCTVTRPGVAPVASSFAVELLASLLQHPERQHASVESGELGFVPHQIRGSLYNFTQNLLQAPNYKHCSACSPPVLDAFEKGGWDFVKNCLNDSTYLEKISGLSLVQQEAELASESMLKEFEISDEEDNEWLD